MTVAKVRILAFVSCPSMRFAASLFMLPVWSSAVVHHHLMPSVMDHVFPSVTYCS